MFSFISKNITNPFKGIAVTFLCHIIKIIKKLLKVVIYYSQSDFNVSYLNKYLIQLTDFTKLQ